LWQAGHFEDGCGETGGGVLEGDRLGSGLEDSSAGNNLCFFSVMKEMVLLLLPPKEVLNYLRALM
jgi:hypothetical protein